MCLHCAMAELREGARRLALARKVRAERLARPHFDQTPQPDGSHLQKRFQLTSKMSPGASLEAFHWSTVQFFFTGLTGGGLALANELKHEYGKRIFLDMKLFHEVLLGEDIFSSIELKKEAEWG